MSRSTYYFEIGKTDVVEERNAKLTKEIEEIFFKNNGDYGVRRVYQELLNQKYHVNHKRVQRIMHKLGLHGKYTAKKYHSYKGEIGKAADNIIDRDFKADAPLQKASTDVSQFQFGWGKCYFSPILDMYNNEIISYDLSLSPNMKQIKRMLDRAFEKYPDMEGLILHSDQGWQYRNEKYQAALKEHHITQSMSRKGNCYDNCIIETFFGRMMTEMYYGCENKYSSFKEFSLAVDVYIHYYYIERIQKKTNWMSPVKYRETSTGNG